MTDLEERLLRQENKIYRQAAEISQRDKDIAILKRRLDHAQWHIERLEKQLKASPAEALFKKGQGNGQG